MGFEGIVISDWRAIHQIPGDYPAQVATSVNAGVDLFMEPTTTEAVGYQQFIATLTRPGRRRHRADERGSTTPCRGS